MKPVSLRKVKSADRVLSLLDLLAQAGRPLSGSEISAALKIPKSSLFHLLGTLEARAYVVQAEPWSYQLGPSISRLSQSRPVSFTPVIERCLEELSATLNESCSLYTEIDDEVEVIATRTSRHALTYAMQIGDRAPLYAVSVGKAILAHKDPAWIDDYLRRVRFEPLTPHTIRSAAQLLRDIEQARKEGIGTVREEFTPGIIGFGAVVRCGGQVVGAINVALPASRVDAAREPQIRRHLAAAAKKAEGQLT